MSACNFGASWNAILWSLMPSRIFCYFQTDNIWMRSVNFWYDYKIPNIFGYDVSEADKFTS